MPTVVIGADVCPIEGNLPYFLSGDAQTLFQDLLPEFERADLALVNLECPLIERPSPIPKTGPTFGENSACVQGLRNAGIRVVNLANNHILDHGPEGLKNTIKVCREAGIDTVGAGENLVAARKILVKPIDTLRVGILSMAEREFSIAGKNEWGANPLDLIDFVRNVRDYRAEFDYLIVLLHGAHEFQAISPRIQNTCRFLIEMGANAVLVQHPHCLGCYENYLHGHIVYGQGALILDEAIYRDLKSFHESFLVKLVIAEDRSSSLEIVPFVQSDPAPGAKKMTGDQLKRFRAAVEEKSRAILKEGYVEAEWLKFCAARQHGYLSAVLGHNRILRKLNQHGLLEKYLYGRKPLLGVSNIIRCETHREAVETIFKHRRAHLIF